MDHFKMNSYIYKYLNLCVFIYIGFKQTIIFKVVNSNDYLYDK